MSEALTYDDVLLVPSYNHWESRKVVDTNITDRSGLLSLEIPVMTSNMDTITEVDMANFIRSKGGVGVLHRFMSIEENVKMLEVCNSPVFVSVGCSEEDLQRAEALRDANAGFFCIDVAHAHAKYVGRTLKNLREMLGKGACIMAGNVATYAGADYLASCGADIIKVGIGGGSVCTTRIKTGFGVPNLTAIKDCTRVDRSVVADGGIRNPGDIVKALAFGADFVMIGSMLAGTRPTPGKVITRTTEDCIVTRPRCDLVVSLFCLNNVGGTATRDHVISRTGQHIFDAPNFIYAGLNTGCTLCGQINIQIGRDISKI